MALQHAYSVGSRFRSLAESAITLSAGNAANKGRLIDGRVDRQYESTAITNLNIDFDFGSAVSLQGIALLNHNLDGAALSSFLIRSADDAAFSVNANTVFSNTTLRATNVFCVHSSTTARRYWRITINHSGSYNKKIGEVYAVAATGGTTPITALSRRVIYGNGGSQSFRTTFAESPYGRLMGGVLSGPLKSRRLLWEDLTLSQKNEILTMHAAANGNGSDLLWVEDYDGTAHSTSQECYFGRFMEDELQYTESDYGLYSGLGLTLREQTRGVGV